eukprot:gnl/Hemi2/19531_TR6493_c0_g1_i1.p1 gnl/Hemi2/19531_TR6493_c0_g1~~gnl/Hemi2/19531_TR6493_c0_g1_i1.p1  ORF type:complete len:330 (-),score=94.27 gnl/Hemi2/19531_TR6493_c0_g1_i1:131-1042(-)
MAAIEEHSEDNYSRTEFMEGDIKTVVEISLNERGLRVKRTTRIRVSSKKLKVNRKVLERKDFRNHKFGACADAGPRPEKNITAIDAEIHFELTRHKDAEDKESEVAEALKVKGASKVICRNCGMVGDHWTAKCPHPRKSEAELIAAMNIPPGTILPEKFESTAAPTAPRGASSLERLAQKIDSGEAFGKDAAGAAVGGSAYVPPGKRNPGPEGGPQRGKEGFTLRISNLSVDTQENDLYDLCGPFGQLSRVYLVRDRQTQLSRNFAFVSYVHQDEAEKAMEKLSGYGYDHLILKVEWAKPSTG